MNMMQILFMFVAFSVLTLLLVDEGAAGFAIEIPEFDPPEVETIDVSAGCSGFFDCTEYLAAVIFNIGAYIINFILFVFSLIIYIITLRVIVEAVTVLAFSDAPWYVNILILSTLAFMMGLIIYKLVRRGSSNA